MPLAVLFGGTGKRPTVVPTTLLPTGVYRASTSRCCWCALTAPLHPYPQQSMKCKVRSLKFHPSSLQASDLRRRYVSVALSSRSPALGVTQQVWPFGSPDFPQTLRERESATTFAYSLLIQSNRREALAVSF